MPAADYWSAGVQLCQSTCLSGSVVLSVCLSACPEFFKMFLLCGNSWRNKLMF